MPVSDKTLGVVEARLPAPLHQNYEWQEKAKCLGMDIEVFFLPDNSRMQNKRLRIEEAKKVCRQCPVIQQCLEYSLRVEEPYGVFGGLSEEERRRVLLRTRRGTKVVSMAN
jgi:WhiB family redox-sensing transcriptional regulator